MVLFHVAQMELSSSKIINMGIKNLTKLISDYAPGAIKEVKDESLLGRVIAIDASLWLYQFMVSIRYGADSLLQTEEGETTSHLKGFLSRTTNMLEKGIKPVFVFDGKPPEMKSTELEKRKESREKAAKDLEEAKEVGDEEKVKKMEKRTVHITKKHNEEVKQLLGMLGIPIVDAVCEAEAQCAVLCKEKKVYAAATEDMDCLTFGTPKLLRYLFSGTMKKRETIEINLDTVLSEMELTMTQFVDLCILCGCDYLSSIRGIGPIKALQMIKKHKTIEQVLDSLDKKKYAVPDSYREQLPAVRELFVHHEVTPVEDMSFKWLNPKEDEIVKFLVEERQFSEENVKRYVQRIRKSKSKRSQKRLDSFFQATPSDVQKQNPLKKRKATVPVGKGAKKAKK